MPEGIGYGGKKSRKKVAAAFREVERDEPEIVGKTRRKKGAKAAQAQKVAIALSKARRAGAKIPRGSGVFGMNELAQGYKSL